MPQRTVAIASHRSKAASADAAFFVSAVAFADLLGDEAVSNGSTYAEYVIGIELYVVLNVVVVTLRADEKVTPEIVADTAADVLHEVSATGVINASRDIAGRKLVEEIVGNADACHDVEAKFSGKLRLEEGVDVSEDGAIVLVAVIAGLFVPPGGLHVKAKAVLEADHIHADVGEEASLFERGVEVHQVAGLIG